LKVRCKTCKEYFEKEEIAYSFSIGNICSDECLRQFQQKESKKKRESVPDDVPGATRKAVLARDKGRCRRCGARNTLLNLHHIRYRSEGVDHSEDNLITLCVFGNDCHAVVHSNKKIYQRLLLKLIELGHEGQHLSLMQLERLPDVKRLLYPDEGSVADSGTES
jgi:hypothetical protein